MKGLQLLPVLALLLGSILAPAVASPVTLPSRPALDGEQDALEDALLALKRASGREDLANRLEALEAVVALGNSDALDPLLGRLVTAAGAADKAEADLADDQITLERKRVQLAELRLALEQNPDLKETVERFEKELEDLEKKMRKASAKVVLDGPWRDALRAGLGSVLNAQGVSKRRALAKDIWKTFEKGDEPALQLASAWLLADLGEPGTAARFARVLTGVLDERVKLKKGLPELESRVHDWERKLQEELVQLGGNTKGMVDGYNQVRSQAAAYNRDLLALERFGEALASSAGLALAKEPDPDGGIDTLLKLARKSAHQASLIDVLVEFGRPECAGPMVAELGLAKEDQYKRSLVDALAALGAREAAEPWLLSEGLTAESWLLRSHSARALAKLRSRAAVPVLLERLAVEEGRLRTDLGAALVSLTGKDFHGNLALWKRWWDENGATFEVPAEAPATSEEKALEAVGLTFFGLRTESQRVLFILDVSGSMEFPMKNYTGAQGKGEGEQRITVAKRELLRALGGIPDGGVFNIVLYASDVWTWSDEPVVMDEGTRAEATKFVEQIKPVGGTNIYGAMKQGLDRARGKDRRKSRGTPRWTPPTYDTVFLLSDGQPSVGLSIAREDILDMVAEENSDLGVQINTIGLSTDQDAVLMRRLAEQSGGTYAAR